MSLIVIEGLDGSGKATQANILFDNISKYKKTKHISFPDYDCPSSSLIKMYLGGEFGSDPDSVNAYAASSFYAVDRFASYKKYWETEYKNGDVIISDRYATSNMIYQAEKVPPNERKEFIAWIEDLEYNKLALPKPDIVIYLDMDPKISQKLLLKRYFGAESKKDIHEKDFDYLLKCRECALDAARTCSWKIIKCYENDEPLTIEEISKKVYNTALEAI